MEAELAMTLIALAVGALFGGVLGYSLGRKHGRKEALGDMELRKVEADWMRAQTALLAGTAKAARKDGE